MTSIEGLNPFDIDFGVLLEEENFTATYKINGNQTLTYTCKCIDQAKVNELVDGDSREFAKTEIEILSRNIV